MKKTMKNKWIKALRSGKYPQGQYQLCLREYEPDFDQYCCLGVLCDINGTLTENGTDNSRDEYSKQPSPYHCRQWGLGSDAVAALIEMNDGGESFAQIADYIEDHL